MSTLALSIPDRRSQRLSRRRCVVFAAVTTMTVLGGLVVAAELALRARAGDWSIAFLGPEVGAVPSDGDGPTRFDDELGYVAAAGTHDWGQWTSTVLPAGWRSNGAPSAHPDQDAIVAVGDSFTFGDEVGDHETWPARLEQELGVPVLNAGVFGYGLDQAVLRAERILAESTARPPSAVVIALVSDDVARCEVSCRHAYKPWFAVREGALVRHHDPVPGQKPTIPLDRRLLGWSHAVRLFGRRVAPGWWYMQETWREHRDGEAVAVLLLARLHATCVERGVRLVVVTLCGRDQDASRLPEVVNGARRRGIEVVDLTGDLAQRPAADFMPLGHLGPDANAWVGREIARRLSP